MLSSRFVLGFLACFGVFELIAAQETRSDGFSSGWKLASRVWQQCLKADSTVGCLKSKALRFVDRALSMEEIPLIQGLTLIRSSYAEGEARDLSDDDVTNPDKVDGLLFERVYRFINEYSVEFNTQENGVKRLIEEGRGKLKKLAGPLLVGGMMKAMMLGLSFMAVAALAGKALMVAKIALVLAALLGVKKLFNDKHHEKVTYEIVKSPGYGGHGEHHGGWEESGGGHYHRSLLGAEDKVYSHGLAYRGQQPTMQQFVVPGTTGATQILVGV